MESLAKNFIGNGSIYSDVQSLDGIRKQARVDKTGAIKAAAKEFEAFFMNMMLKSMRQATESIGDDSMFSSPQEKMFIGMLDEQMSVELSQKGNLGIADLMTRDLLGNTEVHKTDQFVSKQGVPRFSNSSTNTNARTDMNEALTNTTKVEEVINTPNKAGSNQEFELNTPNRIKELSEAKGIAEKKSLFDSATDFIKDLMPAAVKVASKIGLDPKLLVAQAALETGWGKFIMHDESGKPSFNLFGIKGGKEWSGERVNIDSLEVENGTFVKRKDDFRMYENFEKSFEDYADFLKTSPRYQSALELVKDAKQFVESLQESGYATDPNYAKKILKIFEDNSNLNELFNQTSVEVNSASLGGE